MMTMGSLTTTGRMTTTVERGDWKCCLGAESLQIRFGSYGSGQGWRKRYVGRGRDAKEVRAKEVREGFLHVRKMGA